MMLSLIPHMVTFLNFLFGFLAIYRIGERRFEESVWLMALALVFDSLDGNIARIFKVTSELGKELDSLGDVVSFVVAPALYVLVSWPYPVQFWTMAAVFLYLAAGVWRLAHFNINSSPIEKGFFRGLPTPASAILVVMLADGLRGIGLASSLSITITFFSGMLVLAGLMLSPFPYPKVTEVRFKAWWGLFVIVAPLFLLAYWKLNPQFAISVAFLGFVFTGIFNHQKSLLQKKHGALHVMKPETAHHA